MKLKNPNFFISKTRLQVRNVPIDTDQKELKRIFHDAVKRRATQANPRRGCVSTPTSTWVCSHHPPRRHSYTSRRPPPQPPAAAAAAAAFALFTRAPFQRRRLSPPTSRRVDSLTVYRLNVRCIRHHVSNTYPPRVCMYLIK